MKEAARLNPNKSAGTLVKAALRKVEARTQVELPNLGNLQRSANRAREGMHPNQARETICGPDAPKQPSGLDSQVCNTFWVNNLITGNKYECRSI